ncbi:MAG: hypothetical protein J0647_10945 [Campylobacteraceae bacterium]|nr:hypothetical protein [Campylobacteraceae bacterium]
MIKILKWLIGGFACLLFINLVWTVIDLNSSPMYLTSLAKDINTSVSIVGVQDSWALRGQIGDILSGHFSALAFLAVAFSTLLQNQANQKMQISIEKQDKALEQQDKSLQQQSKALEVQSESLKAQIEELQQSRKESERQTEEFFISNINVKLDRYYKILDEKLGHISINKIHKMLEIKETIKVTKAGVEKGSPLSNDERHMMVIELYIWDFIHTLDFIYAEILLLQNTHKRGYELFIQELKLRLKHNYTIDVLYNSSYWKDKCKAFSLLKK